MRNRLIELLNECQHAYDIEVGEAFMANRKPCGENVFYVDHLLAKGVIVLPCEVGDTVYIIEHKIIRECIVTMVKSLTYENVTRYFVEAECEIVSPFYSDGRKIKHGLMAVWEIE